MKISKRSTIQTTHHLGFFNLPDYISIIHSRKKIVPFDISAGIVCTNLSSLSLLRFIMTFSFSILHRSMSSNYLSPSLEFLSITWVSIHKGTILDCPGLIFTVCPAYRFNDLIKKWNDKFLKSAPPSNSYIAF